MHIRYIRAIAALINKTGAEISSVSFTSGGHIRLIVVDPATGIDGFVICSATPKCKGVYDAILRDVRAVLHPCGAVQTRKAAHANRRATA